MVLEWGPEKPPRKFLKFLKVFVIFRRTHNVPWLVDMVAQTMAIGLERFVGVWVVKTSGGGVDGVFILIATVRNIGTWNLLSLGMLSYLVCIDLLNG